MTQEIVFISFILLKYYCSNSIQEQSEVTVHLIMSMLDSEMEDTSIQWGITHEILVDECVTVQPKQTQRT